MLNLLIHVQGAEPYPLDHDHALAEAIAVEAEKVAADAGSDLLESPDDECRAELCSQITRDALAALYGQGDGARYRDPSGVTWSLQEDGEA